MRWKSWFSARRRPVILGVEGSLNDYRMREEFFFQTPELEELYHILKQDGQIDTVALSLLSQEMQTAYYQVLEEILPPETSLEEVQAIEERRNHFLREQDFHKHYY